MILRGGRLSEKVPYFVGALQTMKWVTAFTLRREQKGTFVVHGENPSGGSFLIENLNVQGQRTQLSSTAGREICQEHNVKLRKEKTNIISKCL